MTPAAEAELFNRLTALEAKLTAQATTQGQMGDSYVRLRDEIGRIDLLVRQQDQRITGLAVPPAPVLDQAPYAEIRKLRVELFGDLEARKAWEESQRTGYRPNFPGPQITEPAPGVIESLQAALDKYGQLVERFQESLNTKLSFVVQLEKFFGQFMKDHPDAPLNGEQVATKAFVDESVRRIAGAIRNELAGVRKDLSERSMIAHDVARALIDDLGAFDPNRDNSANSHPREVARKLKRLWDEFADRTRSPHGSRFQEFVSTIFGSGK